MTKEDKVDNRSREKGREGISRKRPAQNDFRHRFARKAKQLVEQRQEDGDPRGKPRSDTRIRLLIAAIDMFANRGFESTTMRDLADSVGIRAPAIYNHFKSKEEILGAALAWAMDDFNREVIDPDDANLPALQRLRAMLARHIEYQLNNFAIARAYDMLLTNGMMTSFAGPESRQLVVERMRKYVKVVSTLVDQARMKENTASHRTIAVHAILTMYDQIGRWYRSRGAITRQELEEAYWGFVLGIIGTDPESRSR
jgi:AcrR family transcriptional regulator